MHKWRKLLCAVLVIVMASSIPVAADFEDGMNAYKNGDYATALRELRPLVESGVAEAQFGLGVMYEKGRGVPQDYAAAAKWYQMAADEGLIYAVWNLGTFYAKGTGVPKDRAYVAKVGVSQRTSEGVYFL